MSAEIDRSPVSLDVDHAPSFLRDEGWIAVSEIVAGGLEIATLQGRNLNLRIERTGGPGYLIKQADPGKRGSQDTLAAEAAFYALCQRDRRLCELTDHLPRLHGSDSEPSLLITELLQDHGPLWQRTPEELEAPAGDLGACLGLLHRLFRETESRSQPTWGTESVSSTPLAQRRSLPWALSMSQPRLELLSQMSTAQQQLLVLIQRQADHLPELETLQKHWQANTLIHGDVRSENILVAGSRIVLVDWELVQWGDPAWDVGGGFQDLLLYWLRSLPTDPELSPEERAEKAGCPLDRLRPAIRAFWDAYQSRAWDIEPNLKAQEAQAEALQRRAVLFSGARLMQSAYEQAAGHRVLPDVAVLALQVAINLLADPDGALSHLYGLDAPAR